jgi:hypothetical protein
MAQGLMHVVPHTCCRTADCRPSTLPSHDCCLVPGGVSNRLVWRPHVESTWTAHHGPCNRLCIVCVTCNASTSCSCSLMADGLHTAGT